MSDSMPGESARPAGSPAERHGQHALAGAVRAFGGMTLLSRLGGLLRDVLLVRVFGATAVGSAFAAAFAIPNMFRRLFGEGALSAAFIPEYAQATKHDPAQADRVASLTVLLLAMVTSAITVIIELVIVVVLLLCEDEPQRTLSLKLIMVMLPFMPLVCIAAILAGMLQVHGRFAASAGGAVLLNAFIIAVGLYSVITGDLGRQTTAYVLGAATVLSGVTQCLWFLRLLRGHVTWTRTIGPARDAAKRMLRRFVPVMLGMGTLQINSFIDTLIAMWPIWVGPTMFGAVYPLDEASNSILSFTQRLYQFPLGVFGIAVASAAFPLLSRHADDPARFAEMLRRGLRLSLFIGLPASIGLVLVREDVTFVLFAGGTTGFGEQVARSAAVLLGFAPAVWAYSLNHVYTRAFYARGDTLTPMKIAIAMMVFNLALNLTLIWPLREAGLAWSTSTAAMLQCVILGSIAEKRFGHADSGRHSLIDRHTLHGMLRIVIAAVTMGVAVIGVAVVFPQPDRWAAHLARLGAMSMAGGIVYALAGALVRCEDLRLLTRWK